MTRPVVLSSSVLLGGLRPWADLLQVLWLVRMIGIEFREVRSWIRKKILISKALRWKNWLRLDFSINGLQIEIWRFQQVRMMILDLSVYSDRVSNVPGAFRHLLWKLAFWKNFINLSWSAFQCYQCSFGIPCRGIAPHGDYDIGSVSGSGFGGP